MTKKILKLLPRLMAMVIGVAAILYVAFYGNAIDSKRVIYVYSTSLHSEVIKEIRSSLRSILHRRAFDFYAQRLRLNERMKSGRYVLSENECVISIVRKFVLGKQLPMNLVVGEARTLPQLAGKLAKQIEADSLSLLTAMRDKDLRKELGLVKDSTISLFIPNTYEVYWSISPEKLLHRISREYSRFWNAERTAKLERCRLSKYEVMTLA